MSPRLFSNKVSCMYHLSHVAAFVEVIETGNFRAASRRLQISQPTVSNSVRRLEDILGVQLVDRGNDRCVPTRHGAIFLPFAKSLLTVSARAFDRLHMEQIQLGASSNIGIYLMPEHLKRLHGAKGRSANLVIASNLEILEKLQRKEVDLAFMEWWDGRNGYEASLWRTEKLILIVSPDHRWASKGSIYSSELFTESLIGGERGTGTGTILRRAFGQKADQLSISHTTGSTEGVKRAVRARLGVSLVMKSTVLDELASGQLCEVSIKGVDLEKPILAVHPVKMEDGSPEAETLSILLNAKTVPVLCQQAARPAEAAN